MQLQINGDVREFNGPLTLSALVEILGLKPDRVAVEVNRLIVAREHWPETDLREGDRLEMVQFVGGGSSRIFRVTALGLGFETTSLRHGLTATGLR